MAVGLKWSKLLGIEPSFVTNYYLDIQLFAPALINYFKNIFINYIK